MNAKQWIDEQALAAWELAEAETLERAAAAKRKSAAKRLGAVHAEMSHALRTAYELQPLRERINQPNPAIPL